MSYYLEGRVSNVSVSFLVDTDTVVSLLNGHAWDQAGLTNVKVSPAPHIQWNSHDSLTISSIAFTQEFVIANNITTCRSQLPAKGGPWLIEGVQ